MTMLATAIALSGTLTIWASKPCSSGAGLCAIPEQLETPVRVEVSYEKPTKLGQFVVADQATTLGAYRVRLLQVWTELAPPEVSYLMTQTELTHIDASGNPKLIAVCSRYDGTEAFAFLPPGACSGNDGARVVGVSISR